MEGQGPSVRHGSRDSSAMEPATEDVPASVPNMNVRGAETSEINAYTSSGGSLSTPPPYYPSHNTNTFSNSVNVNVAMPNIQFNTAKSGAPFIVRAVWWLFIGWWLSFIVAVVGWFFMSTLILMPLGVWFINRLPQAQTLRSRTRAFKTEFKDGSIIFTEGTIPQHPWYYRVIYTLLVGWWAGALWITTGWVIGLTIILLPLSIWMLDRAPAVTSLQRH